MTKIISLSDEAYEKLSRLKGKDSFSKTILRLLENRKPLSAYAGIWKDPRFDEIFEKILEERHETKERTW